MAAPFLFLFIREIRVIRALELLLSGRDVFRCANASRSPGHSARTVCHCRRASPVSPRSSASAFEIAKVQNRTGRILATNDLLITYG